MAFWRIIQVKRMTKEECDSMSFGTTVMQIVALFLIMIVGYVLRKCNVFDDASNVRFTRLIIYVSLPAQIVKAFATNQGIVSNREVLLMFGVSTLAYLLYAIIGFVFNIVFCVPKKKRGTYLFMMMFGNVGFMGMPLTEALLGEEALIYAVIFNVIFNLIVYSVGIVMISNKEDGVRFSYKKLLNMPLISAVVSILLYFCKIQIPDVLIKSLDYMGNVTTPVAMIILGSTIAGMPWKELFDEWRIYVFTAFKLLVIPAVVIALLKVAPEMNPLIYGSLILLSATPVATNTTMLAIEYDGDRALASKGIFFTTLLCMLTIPLIQILV